MNAVLQPSCLTLDTILTPGPVERGLYHVAGGTDAIEDVVQRLVDLLKGESDAPARQTVPGSLLYAGPRRWRRSSHVGPIYWIDCGHTVDSGRIAFAARERGLDPARVLRAIKIVRPISTSQLAQALDEIPKPALWARSNAV